MKQIHDGDTPGADDVVLAFTRDELSLIANAFNEVGEAVEDWEFHTRLGATPEEAETLRSGIVAALRAQS